MNTLESCAVTIWKQRGQSADSLTHVLTNSLTHIHFTGVNEIFGIHFTHLINQGQLTGRFNSHLMNCIVLYLDEAFGNKKQNAEGDGSGIADRLLAIEKLKIDRDKIQKDYELKNKDLKETTRHNKVTEVTDRKKAVQKPTVKK